MCELLGLTFAQAADLSPYLSVFRRHAAANPDGWGLACHRDGAFAVFKEPCRADESCLASFLGAYEPLKSSLFIAHIRAKSPGLPRCYANTHPFTREYRGQDVCWAHNGTLDDLKLGEELKGGPFTSVGTTDSERAFCRFLNWMCCEKIAWTDFEVIEAHLRQINRDYGKSGQPGKLNLLFSNGECLFAFCDLDARYDGGQQGLHYRQHADQPGYVFSTHVLDREPWQRCCPGRLYVIRADTMLWPEGG